MSYCTNYNITIYPEIAIDEFSEKYYEIDECFPFNCESCFSHKGVSAAVKSVSSSLPGIVIVIDGDGEWREDIWREIWMNGKLVLGWQADTEPPEVPEEIISQIDYSILKRKAMSKLSHEERKLLGLEN